jgi:protein gp37
MIYVILKLIHFLSLEPLLGPIGKLDLNDIEWVIAGGESGFNFRECKIEWLRYWDFVKFTFSLIVTASSIVSSFLLLT